MATKTKGDLKFSSLGDDWDAQSGGGFLSPPVSITQPDQMLLFSDRIRNGYIEADITPLAAGKGRGEALSFEADLVVRYTGPDGFYYAGSSAFDSKFFIAKVMPGPIFQLRQAAGRRNAIKAKKTYQLRLEFNASEIILYENKVRQLVLIDEAYSVGQVGLRTWRTQARFENVKLKAKRPKCFLIMPFTTELSFVHRVIDEVVTAHRINCERADEVYLSNPVMDDVKQRIAAADLVIVDFTGKNPNVYYEAGLADAGRKDWIVLAQASEDMTFDVRHIRSIRYSNTMGADIRLREDLAKALSALGYRMKSDANSKE